MEFKRDENRSVVDVRKPANSSRSALSQPSLSGRRHGYQKIVKRIILGFLATVALVASCWLLYNTYNYSGIDRNRYQAVYLSNENVYFGKVEYLLNGNILLHDVFRVQSGEGSANGSDSQAKSSGEIRLIKPGKELHAPDDKMLISKSEVLFIENIKTDGEVTKAIAEYRK